MPWPNFFIVGAPKCGTTSLYHYLKQHPEIYMSSLKEPRFFAPDLHSGMFSDNKRSLRKGKVIQHFQTKPTPSFVVDVITRNPIRGLLVKLHPSYEFYYHELFFGTWIQDKNTYLRLFDGVKTEKAIGEASATYLASEMAPRLIRKMVPDAKIIIILRNPIDRAISHYKDGMNRRWVSGKIIPFQKVIETEMKQISPETLDIEIQNLRFGCLEYGYYVEQINRYLRIFPEEQVKIYLFEDLIHHPRKMLADVCRFLDVSPSFKFDVSRRHNLGKKIIPYHQTIRIIKYLFSKDWLLRKLIKSMRATIAPVFLERSLQLSTRHPFIKANTIRFDTLITRKDRERLKELYYEEIIALSELISRDLSRWLQV